MTQRIYLDYAATAPVRPEVLEAMRPFEGCANPSSLHAEGRRARAAVDDARARIATILRCKPREIVFTSGGTEADNFAIAGAARAGRARGRHIVASAIEHHAVLRTLEALRDEGADVTLAGVDENGVVEPKAFAAALRDDTVAAAVMYANNEIGTIEPVRALADAAHARAVTFVCDAVQAAGSLPLDTGALGVDALALSAHKFGGPKGIGALYVRDGTPLSPLIHGGGQERGRRSGTENVAAIVGFATALELAESERDAYSRQTSRLRDRLEAALAGAIAGARINGKAAARLPNISSVTIPGVPVEPLLIALDLEGIAASAGSACATGSLEPSHVIAAVHGRPAGVEATLRFSLGRTTTEAEIDQVAAVLPRLLAIQHEGTAAPV
ncbi:MAG: cysteine desulfurase family protein [Vulcanimicrobiaceae bacterium]